MPNQDTASRPPDAGAEIHAVLIRYAKALDSRDYDQLAACFTEDAHAVFGGTTFGPGQESIINHLRSAPTHLRSFHFVYNIESKVTDATAVCDSDTIACHVDSDGQGAFLAAVRGLHYSDRLIRYHGNWTLAARTHNLNWSTTIPLHTFDIFPQQ